MRIAPTVLISAAFVASIAILPACEKKESATVPAASMNTDTDHGHAHDSDGEHMASTAGHGGNIIQLGTLKIGPFDAKATRDEGLIAAGKDAPIDVTVTPAAGSDAKAVAVRFWIGTEDGKGSVRAKADIENPAEPNRWHTHTEIPSPIPTGSKLWVEIEDDKGGTSVGSFDLKV